MVRLGFATEGLSAFTAGIGHALTAVKTLVAATAGVAVGIEESIRRVGRTWEKLYYLSQDTGVSVARLKGYQLGFEAIGLSAEEANETISNIAKSIKDNPLTSGTWVRFLGENLKDAGDIFDAAVKRMNDRYKQFGVTAQAHQNAFMDKAAIERLGGNWAAVLRAAHPDNYAEMGHAKHFVETMLKRFGYLDPNQIAKDAVTMGRKFGESWVLAEGAFQRFVTTAFGSVEGIFDKFNRWLGDEEMGRTIDGLATRLKVWLNDPETGKQFTRILDNILCLLKQLVEWAAGGINEENVFSKMTAAVRGLADVLCNVRGFLTDIRTNIKDIADSPLYKLLTMPTPGWLKTITSALPGMGGVAGWFGGLFSLFGGGSGKAAPAAPAEPAGPGFFERWRLRKEEADRKRYGDAGGMRATPASYGGSRLGAASGDPLVDLLQIMGGWFSGDVMFRPIVQLAEETVTKFMAGFERVLETFFPRLVGTEGGGGTGSGEGGSGRGGPVGSGRIGGSGGGRAGPLRGRISNPENLAVGMKHLMDMGIPLEGAAGMMGWMVSESGLNPRAHNDIAGGHTGIMQWDRNRWARYVNKFLPSIGGGEKFDFMNQLKYWVYEQQHTDEARYKVLEKLKNAKTVEEANVATGLTERSGNRTQGLGSGIDIFNKFKGGGAGGASPVRGLGGPSGGGGGGKGGWAAIGDSIAVGLADAAGIPRDAIGGTTPEQIYNRVSKRFGDFAGMNVALAAGSNPNPSALGARQLGFVKQTMEGLKKAGANLVLLGVGRGVTDAAAVNATLGGFAKELGVPFTGELEGTEGGRVHPRNYNATFGQAKRALGSERPVGSGANAGSSTTNNAPVQITQYFNGSTDKDMVTRANEDTRGRLYAHWNNKLIQA